MTERLAVGGAVVEYVVWGSGTPSIIMLHDGLGSIAQWRDTPRAVADRSGAAVLVYNRPGHGGSIPVPVGPWPTLWLHDQARLLADLLDALDIVEPLLVGHSDGGSIGLLHAAGEPGPHGHRTPSPRCRGMVALAAHSFVESVCVEAIRSMRTASEEVVTALGRFHARPAEVFEAWSGVWVSDEFGRWDIRGRLGAIECPTWIVQGDNDQYATTDQLWSTAAAVGDNAEAVLLPDAGHLLHHDDREVVVELVVDAYRASPS